MSGFFSCRNLYFNIKWVWFKGDYMNRFCFGFLSGENYLRKFLLPWISAAGGMMAHEEIENLVALEARKTLGSCYSEGVIFPNHNAFHESRQPDFWGGGIYLDLEISSPQKDKVSEILLRAIRKQSHRSMSEITRYFREHVDMLPAVVIVDPLYGQPIPKSVRVTLERIESLQARLVLTHRITRWSSVNLVAHTTTQRSCLLHADKWNHL
jgi:hypothetical protein